MKKRFLAMLLAGAMVMGLVGCGSSESSKETTNEKTGAEKFKIGVSIMELTAYPWFQGVVDGCNQWAEENAANKGVEIKFDFEDSHSDVQTMLTNLDNMQVVMVLFFFRRMPLLLSQQ